MGDGFSIAWRVLDAQFWGVPQRRRRIFLVADFRGRCAGEILFEREGLSRSFAESRKAWKGITHSLACGSDAKVWDARGNGDGRTCSTITDSAGMSGNNQPVMFYALDRASFNQGINAQYDIGIDDSGIAQTLVAKGPGAVAFGVPLGFRPENTRLYEEVSTTICNGTNPGHHQGVLILDRLIIGLRRLTPTECGRLQGMPDWWCEDVPHSDSAEYKMWGNGMALPCVLYVMENVVSVLSLRLLDSLLEVSG